MLRATLSILLLSSFALDGLVAFRSTRPLHQQKIQLYMLKDKQHDSLGEKFAQALKTVIPKAIPGILLAASLLAIPNDAIAANSGGRSGGSSFSRRSSYSSGSSRTRMNSYSRSYASPTIVAVPSYSPMFSPFGFGFNPFFSPFALFNPNVIVVGLLAYAAYQVLKNRVGGENFDNNFERGSLGSGATVVAVQVRMLRLSFFSFFSHNNRI